MPTAHASRVTPLLVFLLSVFGWMLIVLPSVAEASATGSVRFEFVDAVSGAPLDGFVVEGQQTYQFPDGDPKIRTDVGVGEHTYGGVVGKYGDTIVRVGAPGQPVTVEVVEGAETLVRFEMTPPGRFRFQAVTETDGNPVTQLLQDAHVQVIGPIGSPVQAVNGWFEIDVFPAPIQNLVIIYDPAFPVQGVPYYIYSIPQIASGQVATAAQPLIVKAVPPAVTTSTTTPNPTTSVPVTTVVTLPPTTSTTAPVVVPEGYVVATSLGAVFAFGELDNVGDAAATEVVAIVLHPSGDGYWILEASGEVHAFGDAEDFGRLSGTDFTEGERAATLAVTPSGDGYWLITNLGRVFGFGDAVHRGDLAAFDLVGDVISAAATPSGDGYYLVGSDGGIFSFGDAAFAGSIPQVLPGVVLAAPIVGLTPDPDGVGYWLVAADGGVFGFDAPFRGSIPGVLGPGANLVAAINGMVPFGNGYLLVAGDGGVFNFSNLPFLGSLGDVVLDSPIVAISAI